PLAPSPPPSSLSLTHLPPPMPPPLSLPDALPTSHDRGQLRRAARNPAGERAVRPREGILHQRRRPAPRPLRAGRRRWKDPFSWRSEEHTSELQPLPNLV